MINFVIKKCTFIALLLYGFVSNAQPMAYKTLFIAKDSLSFTFNEPWKFSPVDSPTMSAKGFDDSQWKPMQSFLRLDQLPTNTFNGIGWFRMHFIADSSIVNIPLVLTMKHQGASEIYLDGKLIKTYGEIKDSANCIYYDPQEVPFVIQLNEGGEHVLAVRYANYNANRIFTFYRQPFTGYIMLIGMADSFIVNKNFKTILLTVILIALMGIFFVLSLLHFFMFLFYPSSRSNLFFSLFMFCLGMGWMIAFISASSHSPSLELKSQYLNNFLVCIGCYSLSRFINMLFSKKSTIRYWIIMALVISSILLRIANIHIYPFITVGLIIAVSIEAVIIIIIALYRRVRGARIIGAGILFFALFILTIFTIAILNGGNFDLNDSTTAGRIMVFISALAVLSIPLSMSVYLAWSFGAINKDLKQQLEQVKILSDKNLEQEQEKVRMITGQNEMLEEKVGERTAQLKLEKKKSDDLLLNILPAEVAEELKQTGAAEAKLYDNVTVLFTDFVNFTGISGKLSPTQLVSEIHICFKAFDEIIERHGMEKIKTIGDAYLAVCGLPLSSDDHAVKTVEASFEIAAFIKKRKEEGGLFEIRIGVNSGPVVAGIVGIKKFAYDIWGDTVNLANRMESSSEPGRVNISGTTYEQVKDNFNCTYRGKLPVKHKGEVDMYFVSENSGNG